MLELTEQQRLAVHGSDTPLRLVDPKTNETFVLVRAELYEQISAILGDDLHPSQAYPAMDRVFAKAWDDPKMDDYDRYEELKR